MAQKAIRQWSDMGPGNYRQTPGCDCGGNSRGWLCSELTLPNQRLMLTGAAILDFPSFNVLTAGPGCLALAFGAVPRRRMTIEEKLDALARCGLKLKEQFGVPDLVESWGREALD